MPFNGAQQKELLGDSRVKIIDPVLRGQIAADI